MRNTRRPRSGTNRARLAPSGRTTDRGTQVKTMDHEISARRGVHSRGAQDMPSRNSEPRGMSRGTYVLVGAITLLSLGHHLDHLLRGATGWPFAAEVNPFTYSLVVYPAIAAGLALSRRGRAGPRFWALLSGGGALFVLGVHVGPVAGDAVDQIPAQYASPVAGAIALAELGLFVAALVAASVFDGLRWRRGRRGAPRPESRGRRLVGRAALAVLALVALLLVLNALLAGSEARPAQADVGRTLTLPGHDLQVREDGDPSAPAIVLLHGFGGSLQRFDRAAPALAERHRVIRIDLLGHGGSEKPRDGYGMDEQARQVASALRRLGVRKALIAGHSMGGLVAVALAEREPALVGALILEGSPPEARFTELPLGARLFFAPVIGEALHRLVSASDGLVRQGAAATLAEGAEVPDQFVADFRRATYPAFAGSRAGNVEFLEERPLPERLARLGRPLPLMVIFGTRDRSVDPGAAERYVSVPGVRIERIAGAGHNPLFERPRLTVPPIVEFAARVGS